MSEIEITDAMLDEIEAKAKAATEGRWLAQLIEHEGDEVGHAYIVGADRQGLIGSALPWPTEIYEGDFSRVEANGRHIARMDPPTAMALTAEIRRLRAENASLQRRLDEKIEADNALIDKYRDPDGKSGVFRFPDDVAAIITRLEAENAEIRRKTLEEAATIADDEDERQCKIAQLTVYEEKYGATMARELSEKIATAIRSLTDKEPAR